MDDKTGPLAKVLIIVLCVGILLLLSVCAVPFGFDHDADATKIIEDLEKAATENPELFATPICATPEG